MKNSDSVKLGIIGKWHDDKGYGFILPESDTREVFFHVSAYKVRGARPTLGERVTFTAEPDARGRNRAVAVFPLKPKRSQHAGQAFNAFITSAVFLAMVATLVLINRVPPVLLWLYLGVSIFTYLLYAWDKSSAQHNRRRTPEATLHWLALIGGWPGALFAQQHLRHKSRKQPFRAVFWLTVLINIGTLIYLITPYGSGLLNDINRLLHNLY
ncbi:DUF1294 domain-containing protein [Gilvimarinus agarilyticus]|uniref:DUF1294 domain-containing protein n=1 Tax=Gilvimarinus agarilyticus TaxID=679259 RepID=UPI0005A0ADBD|nr:cold shock and DUF1294 domain-containing protein [Gilvimarinus agarilyticus]